MILLTEQGCMGVCKGHEQAAVSMALRETYSYQDTHFRAPVMADFSKALAKERGLCDVTLPFCHTILSERLGAPIVLGEWDHGVRIGSFENKNGNKNKIQASKIALTDGGASSRQLVLKEAIDLLAQEGIHATLMVDGPLNILTNVLGFETTFRLFRKTPEVVHAMMVQIEQVILEYISAVGRTSVPAEEASSKWAIGAISFADPVASEKILGERVFNALARVHLESLIKSFERFQSQGIAVKICPVLHEALGLSGSGFLSLCQSGKALHSKKD
jgi:hypothetical protein